MMSRILFLAGLVALLFVLPACAPLSPPSPATDNDGVAMPGEPRELAGRSADTGQTSGTEKDYALPVRYQKPAYLIKSREQGKTEGFESGGADIVVPVGADISSAKPVPLRDVLKRLAVLKNMNVSWASDVNQYVMVDVDIRAGDDFFKALDNLLRQVDYFFEIHGSTIVVKFYETKKFHVAMPFMASVFATGVGGGVIEGSSARNKISSVDNKFDIWANIKENLDKVLEIYSETAVTVAPPAADAKGQKAAPKKAAAAKGYYTIDKPIGLITVTAPRPLLAKISNYFDNLKEELYRQISIEAKILEVTLTNDSRTGIDWSNLLKDRTATIDLFDGTGQIYPGRGTVFSKVTIGNDFKLILNAIKEQGKTKVLANPKISVMNGQPALFNVGKSFEYISETATTISDSGVPTTSITKDKLFSGLGIGVVAMISGDDEVILSLTPVISKLEGDAIAFETFGANNENKVGVPVLNMREMNTTVRIKDGEMLVVGGLIDTTDTNADTKVPLLGELPLINKLFKQKVKAETRKELVILLKTRIL